MPPSTSPASDPPSDPAIELTRLLAIMARLRDPASGCPWDREQTFATIAPYTIEEAYEVADAIARDDTADLPDELGDLLFQVVYHARMAEEAGLFDFAVVARGIADKMVRRHPHVFGKEEVAPGWWEAHKLQERRARHRTGTLDGIPVALPALTRALKVTARAARVGFDWPDAPAVLDHLHEEIAELRAELPTPDSSGHDSSGPDSSGPDLSGPDLSGNERPGDPARIADEMGDLLFVAANLARKLGLDPETCLRDATNKFSRRFAGVESRLAAAGLTPADAGLDRMETEWQAVKADERAASAAAPTATDLPSIPAAPLAAALATGQDPA